MSQAISSAQHERGWRQLYLVGGVAALLAALVFRRYWSAELSLLSSLGVIDIGSDAAPTTALAWFEQFQVRPWVALIQFDVLDIVNYALIGLIYLALYGALRRVNLAAVTVALAAGLVGIAVYFASNHAFAMLALSQRYSAATTDVQRALYLAAGEGMLAINYPAPPYPGSGIALALFLVTVAGLIYAVLMLRSSAFGRFAAICGILAHSFMLLLFVVLAVAPAWSPLPPSLSAIFLLVWYVLIAWRLFRLSRAVTPHPVESS